MAGPPGQAIVGAIAKCDIPGFKTISFTTAARRSLAKVAPDDRGRIMATIERYAATGAGDIRTLVGEPGIARLRVGDYRVILAETASSVDVLEVGHRRQIYR